LLQIVLNEPSVVGRLIARVAVSTIRDAPLRTILQACYDLYSEGQLPTFDRISLRLDDSEVRALAAGLLLPIDAQPAEDWFQPTPLDERLKGVLAYLDERERQVRLRDVRAMLKQTDPATNPDEYRALELELTRLYSQRPDTKTKNAS
jgi:DNA primase